MKNGDEKALGWFIDRYSAYVSTIIFHIAGAFLSASDIEEAASDVFYTLWRNADRVSYGKVKAYLGGIARNKAKEKIRNSGVDIPLEEDMILISDDDPIEASEMAKVIKEAVFALPNPDREIFLRHYYYYQTVADISDEMGMNLSTVKTKLHRGRSVLKKKLLEGGWFDENIRHDGSNGCY